MKPDFKVESMKDIFSRNLVSGNVVSTFSGCGGSSLGYALAGFKVLWASEFVPAAASVYAENFPNTYLDARDIRSVTPESILKQTGLDVGDIDILDGSPPCAAFSTSGTLSKGWGAVKKYSDVKQRVDDLFFEYARILQGLQPKTFVAENVTGLSRGCAKGYFKEITVALEQCGYTVQARIVDASFLGVPQKRERLIFVGVRNDLKMLPVFPKPLSYVYSIADAIPWVVTPADELEERLRPESEAWLTDRPLGQRLKKLAVGEKDKKRFNLWRPSVNRPSPTITAMGGGGDASVTHPFELRKFSIVELKRLFTYPEDFALSGTYRQNWERLGRSVPPRMMQAIASSIYDNILKEVKS